MQLVDDDSDVGESPTDDRINPTSVPRTSLLPPLCNAHLWDLQVNITRSTPTGDSASLTATPDMFEDIIYYGFKFQVYSFTKPVSASRATHTLDGTPIEEARAACRQRLASNRPGWGSGGSRYFMMIDVSFVGTTSLRIVRGTVS